MVVLEVHTLAKWYADDIEEHKRLRPHSPVAVSRVLGQQLCFGLSLGLCILGIECKSLRSGNDLVGVVEVSLYC